MALDWADWQTLFSQNPERNTTIRRFLISLDQQASPVFRGRVQKLTSTVAGHAGKLVFGFLGQRIPAVLMVGRAQ